MIAADPATLSRLTTAIEDGELLRIRYDGGSQPGSVRDIRPLRIEGAGLVARDETGKPKTFLMAHLTVVSLDVATTYAPRKTKRKAVDPAAMTRDWAFGVPMEIFAPAFDIVSSRRVYKDLRTGKKMTRAVPAQGDPPVYSFEQGDIFHSPPEARLSPWGAIPQHATLSIKDFDADGVVVDAHIFTAGRSERAAKGVKISFDALLDTLREGPHGSRWAALFGEAG